MDRLHAGVQMVLAGVLPDHAQVPQPNVVNEERHTTSLLRLTREKRHSAIRLMYETLGIKKTDIATLAMSQFMYPTATLALEVPTVAVTSSLHGCQSVLSWFPMTGSLTEWFMELIDFFLSFQFRMENWFWSIPFLFSKKDDQNVPTRNRSRFSNPEFAGFLIFRRFRTTLYILK